MKAALMWKYEFDDETTVTFHFSLFARATESSATLLKTKKKACIRIAASLTEPVGSLPSPALLNDWTANTYTEEAILTAEARLRTCLADLPNSTVTPLQEAERILASAPFDPIALGDEIRHTAVCE